MEIVSIFSSDKKHYYTHLLSQYHRASAQGYMRLLLLAFYMTHALCTALHDYYFIHLRLFQYATMQSDAHREIEGERTCARERERETYDLLKYTNRNNFP